jgi:CheY-like chemotaxis protein
MNLKPCSSETILLAEDDDSLRFLIAQFLVKMGFRVLQASSGECALEFIQKHKDIKLLLSDVIMKGGITGPELVVSALTYNKNLKFMFMSGHPKEFLLRQGYLQDQSYLVLLKPFSSKALEAMLSSLLVR